MRFRYINRHLAALALGASLLACSVYDSELIRVGQIPDAVTDPIDAMVLPPPMAADDADVPGPDEPARPDAGTPAVSRCGDGQMTGTEKCDISIPEGQPGACPMDCPPLDDCAPRLLDGTACNAACVLRELVCQGGDNCCPGKCTAANDSDCSPSCGDGIVQLARGETCDPGSTTTCMKDASGCDDDNPCTRDELTGNPSNCNSACIHTPVTATQAGDSCCPTGANANTDSDCQPMCGNGVREADEECDGSEGCDGSCRSTGTAMQTMCAMTAVDDCQRCACTNCAATEEVCRHGADADVNAKCSAILLCARTNNCTGRPCYCFDALCLLPGPCWNEIQAAAGSTDPFAILDAQDDPSTTVGKAYAADSCRVTQCRATCR